MTDQQTGPAGQAEDGWNECHQGDITGYVRRVNRRHFLGLAAKTTGVASVVVAVGAGFWMNYLRQLESDNQLSGITCSEVPNLIEIYASKHLDRKRSELLEEHVRRCDQCAHYRPKLRPVKA